MNLISIVIPVLNEIEALPENIGYLRTVAGDCEFIVCDGGSSDGTAEWVSSQLDIVLVNAGKGRGKQLRAGVQVANGDTLFFLHADCRPPTNFVSLVQDTIDHSNQAGGAFCVRFSDAHSLSLAVTALLINIRSMILSVATGDQGIFVSRKCYDLSGGFPDWPLFEDVEFVRRVKRTGRLSVLRVPVSISARRWVTNGVWRTNRLMISLHLAFKRGANPEVLKQRYVDVRSDVEK